MAAILLDIHLLEAAANLNELQGDQKDHHRLYRFVFDKHGITREIYDTSFSFYAGHPDLFEKIYQDVIQQMSTMQGEEGKRLRGKDGKRGNRSEGVEPLDTAG